MNLWLDDIRDPALHGRIYGRDYHNWLWATSVFDAIRYLDAGSVTFASLDHDLGLDTPTGYDLVCWMEEHNIWPSDAIAVHSANPVGKERMEAVISRYYRLKEKQTQWTP